LSFIKNWARIRNQDLNLTLETLKKSFRGGSLIIFSMKKMFVLNFRQLIYNYPEQLFADAGVMAIEHADFDGIERLALVTGGEIVSTFDNPKLVRLGQCELIEQVR